MPSRTVAHYLDTRHYLGATGRGWAWSDEYGVLVLAKPTARYLPQDGTWLELVRWCLEGVKNGGSRQWKQVVRYLRVELPEVTTIVSYSDPSVGHTGALYKACNWKWAPTWHRLRPPPSGNGSWADGEQQSVKDRWIYLLRPDVRRDELLAVKDKSILRSLDGAVATDFALVASEHRTPDDAPAVDTSLEPPHRATIDEMFGPPRPGDPIPATWRPVFSGF